jgi:hypothetical protein
MSRLECRSDVFHGDVEIQGHKEDTALSLRAASLKMGERPDLAVWICAIASERFAGKRFSQQLAAKSSALGLRNMRSETEK